MLLLFGSFRERYAYGIYGTAYTVYIWGTHIYYIYTYVYVVDIVRHVELRVQVRVVFVYSIRYMVLVLVLVLVLVMVWVAVGIYIIYVIVGWPIRIRIRTLIDSYAVASRELQLSIVIDWRLRCALSVGNENQRLHQSIKSQLKRFTIKVYDIR